MNSQQFGLFSDFNQKSNSLIDEFIQALEDEIEELKRGGGNTITKVFNGKFLRQEGGYNIYKFHLENFLTALEDSPTKIQIQNRNIEGIIIAVNGLEVEIGINEFLGNFIKEAKLITNIWFLYEKLKKKFIEAKENPRSINFSNSEGVFNNTLNPMDETNAICEQCKSTNRIKKSQDSPICERCGKDLIRYSYGIESPNESQKKAILSSFSSKFSIIWGPPGTGKTQIIAKATEAHIRAGRKVLLVSHANNAVDQALLKVAEQMKTSKFYNDGNLVRLGKPQEELLKKFEEKKCENVLLSKIIQNLGKALSLEKEELQNEQKLIEEKLRKIESIQKYKKSKNNLKSQIINIERERNDLKEKWIKIKKEIDNLNLLRVKEKNNFIKGQNSKTLIKVLKRFDPIKLQKHIDELSMKINNNLNLSNNITSKADELNLVLAEKKSEFNILENQLIKEINILNIPRNKITESQNTYIKREKEINSRIAEIDDQLTKFEEKILSEAKLIATTLTKTFSSKVFPNTQFDVVILDEASMAPLPHYYWALGRCKQSVTIVGDFLQIPPICNAKKSDIAKKWLARNIYDVLKINNVETAIQNDQIDLLDVQYRMVPKISQISNQCFYNEKLKNDIQTETRNNKNYISDNPLILIDSKEINPWCTRLSNGSRFNLYSALLAATIGKKILSENGLDKIGIITPYRAQSKLINKIAKDWDILDNMRISTIHKFQGGEEKVIIFDSTVVDGKTIASWLDDTRNKEASLLLNVAFTRSRDQFIFITHTERFIPFLRPKSSLAKIIHYFKENATLIKSSDIIANYSGDNFERYSSALLGLENSALDIPTGTFYTETNFWPQFFKDLKLTKKRIIILSPFITQNRVAKFIDLLRVKQTQDVNISIFTKPKSQQTGPLADQAATVIDELYNIGIRIVEMSGMHQKIAIIDNNISWEGSLNILSHKDTQEHMRRFEGESTIAEIIRNLDLEEDNPIGMHTRENCPDCDGHLVVKWSKRDSRKFLGCSNFRRSGGCGFTKGIRATNVKQVNT